MPKIFDSVNSFNSGEVSELISGCREDISKYKSACRKLENALPLVEGGAKKMPGTYYGGPCLGKSRLVPFQFSTDQGAFLELSDGLIRIWVNGGLEVGFVGISDYNPATAYVPGNNVLVGSFTTATFTLGSLTIAAPYGQTNADTVPIIISVNSADTLVVSNWGSPPNQGIRIALANATAANNSASAIQTAIRALVSLNSSVNNYIDLSVWTACPDANYAGSPSITAPTNYGSYLHNVQLTYTCLVSNQNSAYPAIWVVNHITHIGSSSPNSPAWGGGTSIATSVIELVTPYAEADLFALDCSTQSADVLWIFHPSYPPACVERLSANSWQYSTSPPGVSSSEPAYRGTTDVVKTGYSALGCYIVTVTPSGSTGNTGPCVITVVPPTPGVVPFQNGQRIYINLCTGTVELNQGEFIVTSMSGPDANGNYLYTLTDPDTGTTINSYAYGAYEGGGFAVSVVALFDAAGDYPACGTLYQERLCFGGSLNNPTRMNGSTQDDYPEFICDPNVDDHAIQFTLVSNKLDQILNMIGTPNALLLGTAGGVWTMAGANGESLSQVSVTASKQTSWGVSALQPQMVGDYSLFVSRSARIVMILIYNFVTNQWDNLDLTRLNRNITLGPSAAQSGLVQTAMQIEPYPIFWAVRADGQLIGLVFNQQDQVAAWFRVNMLPEGGAIESAAVITAQNEEDQLAVVVNRTINGVTQRYFEYFMPQELFGLLSNAFFVHCGQQWRGSGPFSITGISNGNPCVVHAPGHNFQDGQSVQITGVTGMASPSGGQDINQDKTEAYTVTGVSGDTFQLVGMDTSLWSAYASGGTVMQVTNQVTGMSYLLGQNVVAVGDGAQILAPTLVTADAVDFASYSNLITIGIPYEVTVQPMNPVLSSQAATSRGMKQKLNRVTLSLYQSMGGQFGTDANHMYDITYGAGTKGKAPKMSTLELTRDLDADWDDESTFLVTQADPLPFTLRGIVMRMSFNPD
jgi:hypothetical protein